MVDDVGDLAWDQPRIDRMPTPRQGPVTPCSTSKCRKLFQASVATPVTRCDAMDAAAHQPASACDAPRQHSYSDGSGPSTVRETISVPE